jgi:2-amino-4-hydroxy-6-hydroxymethyldihydropteridine diphosphokinase
LRNAARRLRQSLDILSVSSLYETAPVGFQNQPAFLNAVIAVDAPEDPRELHRIIREIEADLGRKRTFANAPRTIDLDILIHGETVLSDGELEIPHPRMATRAFVMVPLAEIAADQVHPILQKSFAEIAAELGDTSNDIRVIDSPEWIDRDQRPSD